MADIITRIAKAHGFETVENADGSVGIIIPTMRNGAPSGDAVETVRTVSEAYAALGY